jgi:2-keto-3-deoxy-L-rhamnonate aldolase RhmA
MGKEVDRAVGKIANAARSASKVFGMAASDALLERWIPQGLTLVLSDMDINMLIFGMKSIHDKYGQ